MYARLISEDTGVTDPTALAEIEEFMRIERRTLDHLTPEEFKREARTANALRGVLATEVESACGTCGGVVSSYTSPLGPIVMHDCRGRRQ